VKLPVHNNGGNLSPVQILKDTRSVSQQVLSGLKISAVLVILVIVSVVFLEFIPTQHIETYYWHLRHGNSVEVGSYRFPVPRQWYVESFSANDVLLVNLNTRDSIAVRLISVPGRSTLGAWDALVSLPDRDGNTKILVRKELQINGETVLCVERNFDTKSVRLYPIECRSEDALEVTFQPSVFSAKDHDHIFYSLLQQLQKI
jgi:hypothetical protein